MQNTWMRMDRKIPVTFSLSVSRAIESHRARDSGILQVKIKFCGLSLGSLGLPTFQIQTQSGLEVEQRNLKNR